MNIETKQKTAKDFARDLVITRVLDANTLPEIEAAKQVLQNWLNAHPEESGMRDGFEQLYTIQEIIEDEDARRAAGEIIPPKPTERERILGQARDTRTEDQGQWAAYELWEWLRRNPADTDARVEFKRFPAMMTIFAEVDAERTHESRQPVEAGQAA